MYSPTPRACKASILSSRDEFIVLKLFASDLDVLVFFEMSCLNKRENRHDASNDTDASCVIVTVW